MPLSVVIVDAVKLAGTVVDIVGRDQEQKIRRCLDDDTNAAALSNDDVK